jgi:hypothetical protein
VGTGKRGQRRIGEEIRNAARLSLDDKGQIAGSRRYFTGVFRVQALDDCSC